MRLYIAGPMTGLPEFNVPAFKAAAVALDDAGHVAVNPAEVTPQADDLAWADYMRSDITALLTCDGVATLPNWWLSRGARLEVHIAASLDIPVRPVPEWMAEAVQHVHPEDFVDAPNHAVPLGS